MFHGVNVVHKKPPWHPSLGDFDAKSSLNEQDMTNLTSWGFNLVRLGLLRRPRGAVAPLSCWIRRDVARCRTSPRPIQPDLPSGASGAEPVVLNWQNLTELTGSPSGDAGAGRPVVRTWHLHDRRLPPRYALRWTLMLPSCLD